MRAFGHTLLAVLVITVWFVALLWMVTSISQIAIERVTTTYSIPPGCSTSEVGECLP